MATGSITNMKTLQKSKWKTTTSAHTIHMQKRPTYKIWRCRNINDSNQDKIIVELREKLGSSEMRQKELEATLTELKKANKITKEGLIEYQIETVKLLQEKKMSEEIIKTFRNFTTIKIKAASDKEIQIKNMQKCLEN